jgi:gliding motility-associated-like protein
MFMPDAFTLNGDNINDIFEIKALFVKNFKMRIYNRAGNVMFETEDYKTGWDGTYEGSTVPIVQYFMKSLPVIIKEKLPKKQVKL